MLNQAACFREPHDLDLARGDARVCVVNVDDQQEPRVAEHYPHVANARWTVALHAAHVAQGDERARAGERAAHAESALGDGDGGAGEVQNLEFGLGHEEDVFDEHAVLQRDLREHRVGHFVVEILLEHRAERSVVAEHGPRVFK